MVVVVGALVLLAVLVVVVVGGVVDRFFGVVVLVCVCVLLFLFLLFLFLFLLPARVFHSHIFALTCAYFSHGLATVGFESANLGRNETRICSSHLHTIVYAYWTGGCLLKKGTGLSLSLSPRCLTLLIGSRSSIFVPWSLVRVAWL